VGSQGPGDEEFLVERESSSSHFIVCEGVEDEASLEGRWRRAGIFRISASGDLFAVAEAVSVTVRIKWIR
jgi:hypothetical protein